MSTETNEDWSDIRGSIGAADVAASEEQADKAEMALLDALGKVRKQKGSTEGDDE